MRKEKHIKALIELLTELRKEPSVPVIGFVYSASLAHMFHLAFYDRIESGRAVKHDDFNSKEKIITLKALIPDFDGKEDMFKLWKEFESKRNEICYSCPDEKDIEHYSQLYFKIKNILEQASGMIFEIQNLEDKE